MDPVNDKNIQYERARKRVKEIKGYYIHALVFVLVNLFLIVSTSIKYDSFETFFQQNQFWGIGLWELDFLLMVYPFSCLILSSEKTGKKRKYVN